MPDPMNFDAVFKQNTGVVLNNFSFDSSEGFIIAVRMHHVNKAKLTVSVAEEHFIMLNAAIPSAAAPQPMYDLPKPDNTETNVSGNNLLTDL